MQEFGILLGMLVLIYGLQRFKAEGLIFQKEMDQITIGKILGYGNGKRGCIAILFIDGSTRTTTFSLDHVNVGGSFSY